MPWLKDELPQSPPRRRGRPKIDNTKLFNDVLMRWLEVGAPDGRNLDRATREIAAANAKGRGTTEKSLRDQLSRAMKNTWPDTIKLLRAAIDVSQKRGVKVPRWAPAKLRALEQREREFRRRGAHDPEAQRRMQAALDLMAKLKRQQDEMRPRIEEAERVVKGRVKAFVRAFGDLLGLGFEELPASIIDALYEDTRQWLLKRLLDVVAKSEVATEIITPDLFRHTWVAHSHK
jgi:hypothetical protein